MMFHLLLLPASRGRSLPAGEDQDCPRRRLGGVHFPAGRLCAGTDAQEIGSLREACRITAEGLNETFMAAVPKEIAEIERMMRG